jgi:hypothetical protein
MLVIVFMLVVVAKINIFSNYAKTFRVFDSGYVYLQKPLRAIIVLLQKQIYLWY